MPEGMRWRTYFFAAVNDGVTGVVAALTADDDIGVPGKDVDDFAFAFIAPLRADQYRVCHRVAAVEKRVAAKALTGSRAATAPER